MQEGTLTMLGFPAECKGMVNEIRERELTKLLITDPWLGISLPSQHFGVGEQVEYGDNEYTVAEKLLDGKAYLLHHSSPEKGTRWGRERVCIHHTYLVAPWMHIRRISNLA